MDSSNPGFDAKSLRKRTGFVARFPWLETGWSIFFRMANLVS